MHPMEKRTADSKRIVIIWGIIPKALASDDEKPHTTFTATAKIVYGPLSVSRSSINIQNLQLAQTLSLFLPSHLTHSNH